ncbi:DUF4291 domain-containing protein [Marinitenerispora sediminis]|uniref:DUF4291 domain-containing protein n=1 Tax=Marinitenerispora sediminis TaxID=1931232 RepID=A0A368T9W8_9ACTN|nr:DUF4291 domain-containing protein [Marinitenerispora sediminis]RCV50653.1 DUF4291 domain-containing protein [Marinitenerispora sediminis]RCV56205.1 DUF4291 domain-containing protein [Marinitenerispora sediminis]RCV59436.1 DUF4291 domain-containing protein [Marinitenerispora sediminis]
MSTTNAVADRRPGRSAREVYAQHDDATLIVYQAYPAAIADAALAAGTFVPPFRRERMTWIKPSFLWMMYRCGYATKRDQERVLAVRITAEGFAWALRNACPSHYDRALFEDRDAWRRRLRESPVRVQWDPERDLAGAPLGHRSLQVGLSGDAVRRYVEEWIVELTDVTPLTVRIRDLRRAGDHAAAAALLPGERPWPAPAGAAAVDRQRGHPADREHQRPR